MIFFLDVSIEILKKFNNNQNSIAQFLLNQRSYLAKENIPSSVGKKNKNIKCPKLENEVAQKFYDSKSIKRFDYILNSVFGLIEISQL